MLKINSECRKGIFFVRLEGVLTKDNYLILRKEITNLVKENGIKNIVFNLEKLIKIDEIGLNELYRNIKISKKNNGTSFICGINKNIKNHYKINLNEINNEISAFNLI